MREQDDERDGDEDQATELPPAAAGLQPIRPETLATVTLQDRTGGFLSILSRLGCSLALSTDESRLLLVGPGTGTATMSSLVLPQLRGVAVQGDLLAVSAADNVHVFKTIGGLAPTMPDAPGVHDAVYLPRAVQFTGRCDLHDMAFVNGAIVAVNTRYSCICKIDGVHSFTPIWQPPFITALRPEDRCHLNGMAIFDNQLRYVTMLGLSDAPGGWRERFVEDGGLVMEAATGRVVASGLSLPHSPRIIGGRLLCLESGRGHLVQIDPDSGDKRILARLSGFTHGLCELGGVLFIGLSKLRSRRPDRPLPLEEDGIEPVCGVVALDAASFDVIGMIEISSGAEEVYDLQLLRGIRHPAIRNVAQAREHQAIELPGEAFWASEPEWAR
jgi:uncharacterized protein (TIGR03032 family)